MIPKNNFSIATVPVDQDVAVGTKGYANDCSATGDWASGAGMTISSQGSSTRIRATKDTTNPSWFELATDFSTHINSTNLFSVELYVYAVQLTSGAQWTLKAKRADLDTWDTIVSGQTGTGRFYYDMRDYLAASQEIDNIRIEVSGSTSGDYIELAWVRIGIVFYIPRIETKEIRSDLRLVQHKIVTRDGDQLQIMGRASREFVMRGEFWEYTNGITIEDAFDSVEKLMAYQISSGNPLYYDDYAHALRGFSEITFTESAAKKAEVRVTLTEETNPT